LARRSCFFNQLVPKVTDKALDNADVISVRNVFMAVLRLTFCLAFVVLELQARCTREEALVGSATTRIAHFVTNLALRAFGRHYSNHCVRSSLGGVYVAIEFAFSIGFTLSD
jgi:hypothetical protein